MSSIPVVCLVGPTGAGKTAASLHLARRFTGGVINLDSRQVYRDFPIITAQPSAEEQACCPHRGYGFLPTEEKISAGRFLDMAHEAVAQTRAEGRLPLLVGGTGLYLRALLDGLADIPQVDPELMQRYEAECDRIGPEALHARLALTDPQYAARIHPHDRQRICRALEVYEGTGKTFSWWHAQPVAASPYRSLRIGIRTDLAALTPKLGIRIDQMLEQGALEEARAAKTRCENPQAPGWSGIGCAELYRHLTGELSLEECKTLWLKNTRAYAKRQLTWFRRDGAVHWVEGTDFAAMDALVEAFLEQSAP